MRGFPHNLCTYTHVRRTCEARGTNRGNVERARSDVVTWQQGEGERCGGGMDVHECVAGQGQGSSRACGRGNVERARSDVAARGERVGGGLDVHECVAGKGREAAARVACVWRERGRQARSRILLQGACRPLRCPTFRCNGCCAGSASGSSCVVRLAEQPLDSLHCTVGVCAEHDAWLLLHASAVLWQVRLVVRAASWRGSCLHGVCARVCACVCVREGGRCPAVGWFG